MATLSGIIQYTGKLGETVGMRGRKSRNYVRKHNAEIRNPKTAGQLIQRAIMTTASRAVSELKNILNNSFQGVNFGGESLNYAQKLFIDMLRQNVAKSSSRYNDRTRYGIAPNAYPVSRGTLPTFNFMGFIENLPYIYKDNVPFSMTDILSVTASQAFPSVRVGDQFTVVILADKNTASGEKEVRAEYCRFAFKNDTTPVFIQKQGGGGWYLNPAAIDVTLAEGRWQELYFLDDSAGGSHYIFINPVDFITWDDFDNIVGAAIIISNKNDKTRSTSNIVINHDLRIEEWYSSITEAYPTYGDVAVEIETPSDYYLQNSSESGTAATPATQLLAAQLFSGEGTVSMANQTAIDIYAPNEGAPVIAMQFSQPITSFSPAYFHQGGFEQNPIYCYVEINEDDNTQLLLLFTERTTSDQSNMGVVNVNGSQFHFRITYTE